MTQFRKKTLFEIIKATVSTGPRVVGATINEPTITQEPIVNLPVKKISRLEPLDKFKDPEHAQNLKRIVKSMKKGRTMPPILVRRTPDGYQAIDGHHRLRAHEILNKQTIRARVISPRNIKIADADNTDEQSPRNITTEKNAKGVNESVYKILEETGKSIHYFDVDKTLMHTDSTLVHVKDPSGKTVQSLNPQEYNHHKLPAGHSYDFSEFSSAAKFDRAKPIRKMLAKMKAIKKNGGKTEILTARSDFDDKVGFTRTWKKFGVDISPGNTHVRRAGNIKLPTHEAKAKIISDSIRQNGHKVVHLYDDHKPNIDAMLALKKEHPDVEFHGHHVEHMEDGSIKITHYKA